jgi:Fe-S cluster assembly protein SufD
MLNQAVVKKSQQISVIESRFSSQPESVDMSFVVEESAGFKLWIITNCSINLEVVMAGQNATADVRIIGIGQNGDVLSIKTRQIHQSPLTTSNLEYRSVLSDQSASEFDGLIEITANGQQSVAYQKNSNLLLSPGAKAASKPFLQILTNDVKCTHGATTGPLNQDQINYLLCRGLTLDQARRELILGGLYSAAEMFANNRSRNRVSKIINQVSQTQFSDA